MSKTNSSSTKGLRGKIIVIGLLASTLAGLLGQELMVAGNNPSADVEPRRLPKVTATPTAPTKKRVVLPHEVDLEKVLAYDPFAPPSTMSKVEEKLTEEAVSSANAEAEENARRIERVATLKSALQKWKQTGVRTIVETPSGKAAVVGDSVIREGDVIDGFRVVRISKDGIDLAVERE